MADPVATSEGDEDGGGWGGDDADRLLATEALMSGTRLERSTFAVLAVIGQQLLEIGQPTDSVRVLEAALRVPHAGHDHQRVLACVLSTLAAACWATDRFHASIVYSLRAIAVANTQRRHLRLEHARSICALYKFFNNNNNNNNNGPIALSSFSSCH